MSATFHWASIIEPLEPRVLLTTVYEIQAIPTPTHPTAAWNDIRISDVNDAGQVVATVWNSTEKSVRSFFLGGSGTTDLGSLGGRVTWAHAINAAGQVVVLQQRRESRVLHDHGDPDPPGPRFRRSRRALCW